MDRLSSARVDTQNEQNLRPGIVKDTIFVGANETTQVDMGKVFGQDRNVITPDNNTSAVFFTAKKIDSGAMEQWKHQLVTKNNNNKRNSSSNGKL